jgi:hypothetical protein
MMPSTCAEIIYTYRQLSCNFTRSLPVVLERYPACANVNFSGDDILSTTGEDVFVVVNASLRRKRPEEIFALLSSTYGVAAWMGLMIHALAIEVYLGRSRKKKMI